MDRLVPLPIMNAPIHAGVAGDRTDAASQRDFDRRDTARQSDLRRRFFNRQTAECLLNNVLTVFTFSSNPQLQSGRVCFNQFRKLHGIQRHHAVRGIR